MKRNFPRDGDLLLKAPKFLSFSKIEQRAYAALIKKLDSLPKVGTFTAALGLDQVQAVYEALPKQSTQRIIHIAGSNGKGSTASFVTTILAEHGYRVGLLTSPHLITPLERFQIHEKKTGRRILKPSFWLKALQIIQTAKNNIHQPSSRQPLSFFEDVILASFVMARSCDFIVIEAGLGARLDATRIFDAELSILTDLSLEHTDWLGPTIQDVAREEACVMRPNGVLIMADAVDEAEEVVDKLAEEANVRVLRLGRDFFVQKVKEPIRKRTFLLQDGYKVQAEPGLYGDHQDRNAALALSACLICLDEKFDALHAQRGLAATEWPGRLEAFYSGRKRGRSQIPEVILDGAHNLQGMEALIAAIPTLFENPPVVVVGILEDKEPAEMIKRLEPWVNEFVFTRAPSERAVPGKVLRSKACRGIVVEKPEIAFQIALEKAKREGTQILVVGSLYLVGAIRAFLLDKGYRGVPVRI